MLLESSSSDILDPKDAAETAGLVYVSDKEPGIRRKKAGKASPISGRAGARSRTRRR
jgi:DNA topoisomerase-1